MLTRPARAVPSLALLITRFRIVEGIGQAGIVVMCWTDGFAEEDLGSTDMMT
jgi:hypothetical protein